MSTIITFLPYQLKTYQTGLLW